MNVENNEPAKVVTKRALSLDDLVNHDENDISKLQKISDQSDKKFEQEKEYIQEISDPPLANPASEGSNNSETDTDDDVGGSGEINFDADMAFDYDKQDRNSPGKPKLKSTSTKVKFVTPNPVLISKSIPEIIAIDTTTGEQTNDKVEPQVTDIKKEDSKVKSDIKEVEDIVMTKVEEFQGVQTEVHQDTNVKVNEDDTTVNNIFEEKVTSKSKRNNIKKDIQLLNEIAAISKPNKYKNAPIWAQKWKPTVKALQSIDTKDFKIDQSFLNFIPDDDLTKSVQDWVYATIYSIEPDLRQFIEMEMKFGLIVDSKGTDRVNPPISSQAIFTDMDAHLTPNIDDVLFKELIKYIKGISELNENTGKFSVIESHTNDSLYRVGVSTQRPRFLRMSTDIKTGRIGQFIEKRHVAQLMLYSPKDSYDIKISINLELPVPENEPPEKFKGQEPINQRTKERVSYIHNDSCTRIDITKVSNHNQGMKNSETEITHEVELEINTPALLNSFENISNDSKEYASIIRTFLSNGTIVRRKLSSLSYSIFEG